MLRLQKPVIPAGQRNTCFDKIKHGGYGVNLIGEVSEKHPLPQGLELKNSYCDLTPGSSKANLMIANTTSRCITIPAKAIVCQLNLANKIPKLLLPSCELEYESKEFDTGLDSFSPGQTDLDDHDLGLTFEKFRAHQVLVQDLGEDPDHDRDKSHNDLTNLKFAPNSTPDKDKEQRNTIENEDCKDSGEWLLDQLDPTGLNEWPKIFTREGQGHAQKESYF